MRHFAEAPEEDLPTLGIVAVNVTWRVDTFGYAESYDEAAARYRGLRCGQEVNISSDSMREVCSLAIS